MPPFIVDFGKSVGTVDGLARVVGISTDLVQRKLDGDATLFTLHRIPKRRPGTYRDVWEVTDEGLCDGLKTLEGRLFDFIKATKSDFPHSSCHGYVPKRSILTNAETHLRAKVLVRADIRDFFLSITTARVITLLLEFGLPSTPAQLLAKFLTHNGSLPLGFPTSPTVSNAVCLELDRKLTALSVALGARYSRYSDDLTFSSIGAVPSRIDISSIVEEQGFQLNRDKYRVKNRGQVFYVTGLSISEPDRPRAPRNLKRRLRQELYYAAKQGLRHHLGKRGYASLQAGVNKIDGRLKFLRAIEPVFATPLLEEWKAILKRDGMEPVHTARIGRAPRNVVMMFDESVIETSAGKVLVLGCVVTEDLDSIRGEVSGLLARTLADPFSDGRKRDLEKRGLHWVDVAEDVRTDIVQTLASFTVRCYVSYRMYPDGIGFWEAYQSLLQPMILPRFRALDRCIVQTKFEQHSALKQAALEELVSIAYGELEKAKGRRPLTVPSVTIVSKLEEPCISVVDGMLAVLGEYAVSQPPGDPNRPKEKRTLPGQHVQNRFERLRGKYRLIRSEVTAETFTRRRRFEPWEGADPTKTRTGT